MSEAKVVNAPPSFSDATGKRWTIDPSLGLFDRIQAATAVDLLASDADLSPIIGLLFDQRKLGLVLWEAVGGAGDVQAFRDSLTADTLTAGWGALYDAVLFFTPLQSRKAVEAALESQLAVIEHGAKAIAEVAASEETKRAMEATVSGLKNEMQSDLVKAFAKSATS